MLLFIIVVSTINIFRMLCGSVKPFTFMIFIDVHPHNIFNIFHRQLFPLPLYFRDIVFTHPSCTCVFVLRVLKNFKINRTNYNNHHSSIRYNIMYTCCIKKNCYLYVRCKHNIVYGKLKTKRLRKITKFHVRKGKKNMYTY